MTATGSAPSVALALQGGGSHGAFTWGALDRLLEEVERGTLLVSAVSGSSAGAINAALLASGLARGGPAAARRKLREFWEAVSRRGFRAGNPFFGLAEPSPFGGWNIDWSPIAIEMEAVALVVSPYSNPFYSDALRPLLEEALAPPDLEALNGPAAAPRVFMSATNVRDNERKIFTQPDITIDVLRASACLPTEFQAVAIGGVPYWDGGYLGNPPLSPLVDVCQELVLVLANPLVRQDMPPKQARAILARLNEITFNASVVLEINAIEAVNRVLAACATAGLPPPSKYRPVHFHCIRDDLYMAGFGVVSKSSTSEALLSALFAGGRKAADKWLGTHGHHLGRASSCNVHRELVKPVLS